MKLNHALLICQQLSVTEDFFIHVLGFSKGPRPPFPFTGSWLYCDGKPQLHLVSAAPSESQQTYLQTEDTDTAARRPGIIDHLAFQGDCYASLIKRLDEQQATYFERTIPLSNEHQVFVIGPEQIKIEILFNQDRSPLS